MFHKILLLIELKNHKIRVVVSNHLNRRGQKVHIVKDRFFVARRVATRRYRRHVFLDSSKHDQLRPSGHQRVQDGLLGSRQGRVTSKGEPFDGVFFRQGLADIQDVHGKAVAGTPAGI